MFQQTADLHDLLLYSMLPKRVLLQRLIEARNNAWEDKDTADVC